MLKHINFSSKSLKGTIYTFEKAGDILPMHGHSPTGTPMHISIVARGSFRYHGPLIGEHTLKAGAFVDHEDDFVTHEFVALEDNSRLFNIAR
jgi:hypothetical protein